MIFLQDEYGTGNSGAVLPKNIIFIWRETKVNQIIAKFLESTTTIITILFLFSRIRELIYYYRFVFAV